MQLTKLILTVHRGSYMTYDSTRRNIIHEIEIGSQDNMFKNVRSLLHVCGDAAVRSDEVNRTTDFFRTKELDCHYEISAHFRWYQE